MDRDEGEEIPEDRADAISSAFFFREMALRLFHDLANRLATLDSSLLLMEALVESDQTQAAPRPELQRLLREALRTLADAQRLLGTTRSTAAPHSAVAVPCLLVAEVLRPAVDHIMAKAYARGVRLRASFGSEDYSVLVNPDLLREVVIALLDNALWAISENRSGHRRLFVEVRRPDNKSVRVVIRDDGIGIHPDAARRVFEPFFTTRSTGTGLGLYFARQVLKRSGGILALERSVHGKGSTFSLVLPTTAGRT